MMALGTSLTHSILGVRLVAHKGEVNRRGFWGHVPARHTALRTVSLLERGENSNARERAGKPALFPATLDDRRAWKASTKPPCPGNADAPALRLCAIRGEVEADAQSDSGTSPVPVPPMVLQCVLLACLGAFSFGYHISVVNGPLPYILADIGATGSSLVGGLIVSSSLAAAAVGALMAGPLADTVGRRGALALDAIPFIFGSILSATASSVPQMILGRIIVGAAFGIVSSTVPLYIAEVTPPAVRGAYGSLGQLFCCTGIFAALLAGLPLPLSSSWWRAMFFLGALPPLALAAGMLLWAPETPAWLAKKGRFDEAASSVARLSGVPEGAFVSASSLQVPSSGAFEDPSDGSESGGVGLAELFSPRYRKVVVIGMAMFALQQFAGINAVIYYSSSVFQRVGIQSDILASALVALVNVAGTFVSVRLVDSEGRKKLLLASFAGMGLSMLLLSFTLSLHMPQPLAGTLSVLGTMAYVLSFAFGVGPIPSVLLPELFPAAIRANAMAMSFLSHWVCNFLIGLSFLGVVEAVGVAGAYLGFAICCAVGASFVYLVLPETKGRSLEDIEREFAKLED